MTNDKYKSLLNDLYLQKNPAKAALLQRFFKTGKGEYGEGDVFLGIMVPQTRELVCKYQTLALNDIKRLLKSKYHEARLTGVLILVRQYQKAKEEKSRKEIFNFYLKNSQGINNWDLVDLSAHKIVGAYLFDKDRQLLYKLATSKNLWQRRIAVISTFWFIHNYDFKDSLKLTALLLKDEHDLLHKATGWMLREIGKRDKKVLIDFLDKHYRQMPRTMLRYAIEKFSDVERKKYLDKSKI